MAAFSAAKGAGSATSDAPCRAPPAVRQCQTRARNQDRFRCPLVKDEQLSPARSAFLRQVLPSVRSRGQEPATGLAALPPSSRLPALFRPFQCSRMKGLDPARFHRLIARGREDRTPLVEFCNRERSASTARAIERTLHTAPGSPPRAACLQVAAPLSRRSQPRFHGPGAGGRLSKRRCRLLPARSLAEEAYPQPDQLEHLLSQARFSAGRRSRCRGD